MRACASTQSGIPSSLQAQGRPLAGRENGSSPEKEAVWPVPPTPQHPRVKATLSPTPSEPSYQQTSNRGGKVRQSHGVELQDSGRAYSLPPPAARSGEEVINKGSCLLSTWNIPGLMTKTQCHNLLNPKHTTPGELLTVQRKKQRLRGVKSLA